MIHSAALLKDLKGQLKLLVADLRARAEDPGDAWGSRLKEEYAEARKRERTGHSWPVWRDNEVDQAAVAWIIATTFLRFCEDNDLLTGAYLDGRLTPIGWIAGPGDRTALAEENLTAYFRVNPTHNRRHWLQQGFAVLAAQPAGKALIDRKHNPVWTALISPESATALVEFWRRTDDAGSLIHDFTDADFGTRFLGDLYQDLSEHAKKTYALLQTPEFVEEFILDQTLTPALKEFGHDGLKLIDPTCGSGHFLLGAFHRIVTMWEHEAPGIDVKERVRRAMDSIHGVDLNPFAVAIARFRLTVAGIVSSGERSLVAVPALGHHLAIGDSLLGERGGVPAVLPGLNEAEDPDSDQTYLYATEDLADYVGILQPGKYHVVIGNPPYITVKDSVLSKLYRRMYPIAMGTYPLSVPFMDLFFRLAFRGEQGLPAGYVGKITSNSFMKRGFGKKLVEDFFGGRDPVRVDPIDLTLVVDTSGAFIPGHGTPTVVVVGRRRRPVLGVVRAVLGIRGEPGEPEVPARGKVWAEIVANVNNLGFVGIFVSVVDLDRLKLSQHPLSLTGGGASTVFDCIERQPSRLVNVIDPGIGRAARIGADDVFARPLWYRSHFNNDSRAIPMLQGEGVRDYSCNIQQLVLHPYLNGKRSEGALSRELWPWRAPLAERSTFQGKMADAGRAWWEYMQFTASAYTTSLSISFANVGTHNHFSLDRGGKIFTAHSPVIKLPSGTSEDQYLELLGVLNSSTACFWLKQVSHDKGSQSGSGGFMHDEWERFFEFTGTKLERFPLSAELPLVRGRVLDVLAYELDQTLPRTLVAEWQRSAGSSSASLGQRLKEGGAAWERLRERMIFEQEELDWEVYRLYGLLDDGLTYAGDQTEQLALGQRAFEIGLARQIESGEEESVWFARHGSTSITEMPTVWPADYTALVKRRLDLIDSDPNLRLLEKPEFKRRWAVTPWSVQLTEALEAAILDRLERAELWRDEQGPQIRSVAEVADLLRADAVLLELVAVLSGSAEPDLAAVLGSLVGDEAVPYLAVHRYKPSGLEKFRTWQGVWELQRREDVGEKVDIAVPPKYGKPDFRKDAYWKARGKLDVPKERFVLYPDLRREADRTLVIGWAGWDHRDQALALGRELPVQESLGADDEALTPLVAGLVELEPWLHQWHAEEEPVFGASPAAVITQVIDQYLLRMEKTRDDVTAWTPPVPTRGRRPKRS